MAGFNVPYIAMKRVCNRKRTKHFSKTFIVLFAIFTAIQLLHRYATMN